VDRIAASERATAGEPASRCRRRLRSLARPSHTHRSAKQSRAPTCPRGNRGAIRARATRMGKVVRPCGGPPSLRAVARSWQRCQSGEARSWVLANRLPVGVPPRRATQPSTRKPMRFASPPRSPVTYVNTASAFWSSVSPKRDDPTRALRTGVGDSPLLDPMSGRIREGPGNRATLKANTSCLARRPEQQCGV
jgi:hypothetical protein